MSLWKAPHTLAFPNSWKEGRGGSSFLMLWGQKIKQRTVSPAGGPRGVVELQRGYV